MNDDARAADGCHCRKLFWIGSLALFTLSIGSGGRA